MVQMRILKGLLQGMNQREKGTYNCKMWREKVGTSSNQSELQEGKNNKIKRFFRPTIFLKAKMGEHHEENDTELKSNLENKIPFFYSFL